MVTVLLLAAAASAVAREGLAWEPDKPAQVAVALRALAASDLDGAAGQELEGSRAGIDAAYHWPGGLLLSLGYSYDALDFEISAERAPLTTGDLHTLHIGLGWQRSWAGGEVAALLAPALSASSNAIKEPGQWQGDMLQWWGAAHYTRPAGGLDWVAGLASDHRFGDQRVYPLLGLRWEDADTRLRLVYPDLLLQQQLAATWALAFSLSPDGNQWWVFEDNREQGGDLVREGWRGEVQLRKRWWRRLEAALSLGYLWRQEWTFDNAAGQRVTLESDNTPTVGLHLRWLLAPAPSTTPAPRGSP